MFLLNGIEAGLDWPTGLLHGRDAQLQKDPSKPAFEVGDWRNLLLLPVLYRKWGCVRFFRLHPWVMTWVMEGMFAGVPGHAAEDAWWIMSLVMESVLLSSQWVGGAAVDIFKCFDQLPRELVAKVLILAGMPRKIVDAYMRYHNNLKVYNSVAGGLGKPYRRRCAIPQGCPFSMMFVAILLRPILILCAVPGRVLPRILVDDIILVVLGGGDCCKGPWQVLAT